jgi:hypothetical protein
VHKNFAETPPFAGVFAVGGVSAICGVFVIGGVSDAARFCTSAAVYVIALLLSSMLLLASCNYRLNGF